jgi:hypothetical protein
MVQVQMIIMATDRNGTEQFYLGHFGMEALKRSTIPDMNNRPNEYLEFITLCNDNGYQMINDRAARLKATKKRESLAKTSTKVTPTQKRKKLKRSPTNILIVLILIHILILRRRRRRRQRQGHRQRT